MKVIELTTNPPSVSDLLERDPGEPQHLEDLRVHVRQAFRDHIDQHDGHPPG